MQKCLNCGKSEENVPLVMITYSGKPNYICSSCLPMLIHHPEKLAGKLDNAENIPAAKHKND